MRQTTKNCACNPYYVHYKAGADPRRRAVYGDGWRPLACYDCGFESRRRHICLSLVSVVSCQLELSATSRSLVQSIPTNYGVSLCVI